MHPLKRVVYKTPDEIEAVASVRSIEAMKLPAGLARQTILREVASLQQYAMMKRVLAPSVKIDGKQARDLHNKPLSTAPGVQRRSAAKPA